MCVNGGDVMCVSREKKKSRETRMHVLAEIGVLFFWDALQLSSSHTHTSSSHLFSPVLAMGMLSAPLFTNKPDAVVDLKKLREWKERGLDLSFVDDAAWADGDTMRLGDFLQLCSGKLYVYLRGTLMMAWDVIAGCTSEAASLYFYDEEDEVFRIDLDPVTQRRLCNDIGEPIEGSWGETFCKKGKAMWFLTDGKSHSSMKLRSGKGGQTFPPALPSAYPDELPTKQEIEEYQAFAHFISDLKINLDHFRTADLNGQLEWRRADTDRFGSWM